MNLYEIDWVAAWIVDAGEWDNTLVMTYSEFGRRAAENQSGGTDHGTAAPHLLMGGQLNGGLYGSAPDLSQLIDGDPAYTQCPCGTALLIARSDGAFTNNTVDCFTTTEFERDGTWHLSAP